MIEVNKIYNENCLDTLDRMPDCFVDLTVTSPPYDGIRNYNGYSFEFNRTAKELFRITKNGGVVVWIVADQAPNGSETGTSFKQALFFMECGFNLFDTMFYHKNGMPMRGNLNGYNQTVEYMFVFSKGAISTSNIIYDRPNKSAHKVRKTTNRGKDGIVNDQGMCKTETNGRRENIWSYNTGQDEDNINHPAKFPEKLAADHIFSWSNKNDLVYDPFSGSGTTCKMAHLQKRNWVGSEISKEYFELSEKRIAPYLAQTSLF